MRRLVPLTETDARDMLSSLRAFPVLQKSPARLQGLIAAVKKCRYDLESVADEEIQNLATKVTRQPPDVMEKMEKILDN
jgi:hypothetical protein